MKLMAAALLWRALDGENFEDFVEPIGTARVAAIEEGGARVMPVHLRAGDGRRDRTWQAVRESVRECELKDFGVSEPRTASWCMRFLRRQQMHPDDYHMRWRQRHKLGAVDWGVTAHQTAMRGMALAGCSDQLDVVNLAVVERLMQVAQMVEHHKRQIEKDLEDKAVREKKRGGLPLDEADLFLGISQGVFDSMICPDLREHVANAFEREANVAKQTRKAREERGAGRK